jgi:hypothetical protein
MLPELWRSHAVCALNPKNRRIGRPVPGSEAVWDDEGQRRGDGNAEQDVILFFHWWETPHAGVGFRLATTAESSIGRKKFAGEREKKGSARPPFSRITGDRKLSDAARFVLRFRLGNMWEASSVSSSKFGKQRSLKTLVFFCRLLFQRLMVFCNRTAICAARILRTVEAIKRRDAGETLADIAKSNAVHLSMISRL